MRTKGNDRLSEKEKLFCTYYSTHQNALEAAIKAGYSKKPERTAAQLLKKPAICHYISYLTEQNAATEKEIAAGFRRLAFGCITDAVQLAFSEEIDAQTLKGLDLFSVSEIKVTRGKSVEIKFFDRLKALEKLSAIVTNGEKAQGGSFFDAIEKGAKALGVSADNE